MFANQKIKSIFALRNLFNGSVNHRIYRILHKRLGVVFLYSNTTVSGFRNFESITLSLYSILTKFKFFTSAKPSKKFSTREQQYLTTNAQPSDKGAKKSKQKLAVSKKCLTFASLQSYNSDANHRLFYTEIKRLGVVYLYSNGIAISGCSKLERATLFSFNKIFNLLNHFTNATTSKRFSTAEQQYATTNAQPCDKGAIATQSIKKKELGAYRLLSAIGLFVRELYRDVRNISAQVVQDFQQNNEHCYTICPDQRQGVLWQWKNLCGGVSKPNENYPKSTDRLLNSFS